MSRPQRVSSRQYLLNFESELFHHDWKTWCFLLLLSLPGTVEENPDLYQWLEKGKRAKSAFICPSCNANRLRLPETQQTRTLSALKERPGAGRKESIFLSNLDSWERRAGISLYEAVTHWWTWWGNDFFSFFSEHISIDFFLNKTVKQLELNWWYM